MEFCSGFISEGLVENKGDVSAGKLLAWIARSRLSFEELKGRPL